MAKFTVLVNVLGQESVFRFEVEARYPRVAAASAMERLESEHPDFRHAINGCTIFRRSMRTPATIASEEELAEEADALAPAERAAFDALPTYEEVQAAEQAENDAQNDVTFGPITGQLWPNQNPDMGAFFEKAADSLYRSAPRRGASGRTWREYHP